MQTHMLKWRVVLMVAVVAWVEWGTPQAWAQRARVPQTGQTTCWNHSLGTLIPCDETEQDGDIEAGVAWPTPRFTDRGNGTVRDNLTGLMWLKNADCFGSRLWMQALTDANTLTSGTCGLTDGSVAGDWYLPNVKELLSLIDYSQFDPALPDSHPFSNVRGETYWTSTTRMSDAVQFAVANPFVVRLQEGTAFGGGPPPTVFLVWPVRGGN